MAGEADRGTPRETAKATSKEMGNGRGGPENTGLRVGVIVAVVLAVVLVGWLLLRGGDDSSDSSESAGGGGGAEAATVESLRERATERGTPIYWAGPQEGTTLEYTEPNGGETAYVRYLSGDAEPGDPSPDFLTVGTYTFADPVSALKKQGKQPGGVLASAPGGATVYFNRESPQSVYLAFPGIEVQIEVYDPDPERALKLVTAGQIVPVS
jgi:hypothetical protein